MGDTVRGMTSATEPPPVTAPPLDLSMLHACTAEKTASLRNLAARYGLTPGEQAADMLNVSTAGLIEAIGAGRLSGIVVDGQAWVIAEQLQAQLVEAATTGLARTVELRALARTALRAYLAETPVVDEWGIAREEGRPLVCARRGATWVHFGVEYHTVALNSAWLSAWSVDPGVRERVPEVAALPAGEALYRALLGLPGVDPVRYVRGLDHGEKTHRVNGWVKVDPRVWTLNIPDIVAEAIANPRRGEQE